MKQGRAHAGIAAASLLQSGVVPATATQVLVDPDDPDDSFAVVVAIVFEPVPAPPEPDPVAEYDPVMVEHVVVVVPGTFAQEQTALAAERTRARSDEEQDLSAQGVTSDVKAA